jgi:TRAP-type C4-dicarboxylate transport system permease small subunit
MRSFMHSYLRVFDVVNVVIRYVLVLLLAGMTVLIGWQVFARFVVGESLTFSEEVSRFAMVWLVVLGAAYAAQSGRLIKVDVLEHVLGSGARKAAIITAGCVSIVFYLVLVVFGMFITEAVSFQRTPATEISMSVPMAALPVGGAFLVLNTVYHLFATALGVRQASEVDEILTEAGEVES